MKATLTIRLSQERRRELKELAAALGKPESEVVRQMIERGLAEESLGARLAHLKGSLSRSPSSDEGLSDAIRQRNWRS